jgi:peptidoglycan/xylan/chitin deacetylase (PgdA/CDA1 family)
VNARQGVVSLAKKGLKLALLPAAMAGREPRPGLFVLIYHRVGAGQGREMDLPVRAFAAQMRGLRAQADVVHLSDGLAALTEGSLVRDAVAVTFDDGYREVYTNAWPVLRDLDIPATVFLPTGFMEGSSPAPIRPGAADRGAEPRALDWTQVGEMVETGSMGVGSHSVTHPEFDTLSRDEAEDEAARSKEVVAERTGVRTELFAYPRAKVAHHDVVATHYRYAVAADGVKNVDVSDGLVARTPVRASDGVFFFTWKLKGMRPLEDRVYRRLRRGLP